MKKFIITFLSYATTLSSLSVMVISRRKIGENTFLPVGMKFRHPFVRIFMRLLIVALLFIYVRIFFVIEVRSRSDIAPFEANTTAWEFLTGISMPMGWGPHILLYYYSYIVVLMGLAHILLLEVYYRNGTSTGRLSLGKSWLFGKLEGEKVFHSTIDDFFVNGIIEPAFFIGIGYALTWIKGTAVICVFLMMAGSGMFLQSVLSWLDLRNKLQDARDAEKLACRMRKVRDRKGSAYNTENDEENFVRIAE